MDKLTSFETITPEEAGLPSAAVLDFIETAKQRDIELHSLMILRHNKAAAALWWKPYAPDIPHHLYSFSKSITATAVGFAISEGLLTTDRRITSFFPHRTGRNADPRIYSVTVEHLLTMTSGVVSANEATMQTRTDWVEWFLNSPLDSFPGDRFNYNSLNTYMLSAIIRVVTGQGLTDYLYPRLFEPLGIERPDWAKSPMGIECGGWGLSLTTEDMAKFCQLYLDDGMYRGRRVLPEGWARSVGVKRADSSVDDKFKGSINSVNGYGYQFWINRDGSFRADGMMGQYGVILPEKDAVIITTAGNVEQMMLLDLIYEKLIPFIDFIPEHSPAGEQYGALCMLSETLALDRPEPSARPSGLEELISGMTYVFPHNFYSMLPFAIRYLYDIPPLGVDGLSVTFSEGQCVLSWREDSSPHTVSFSFDSEYSFGSLTYGADTFRTAVCGAWVSGDTLEIDIRMIRTPHMSRIVMRFDGDRVYCRFDEDPPIEESARYLLELVKPLRSVSGRISRFVTKNLPELVGTCVHPAQPAE